MELEKKLGVFIIVISLIVIAILLLFKTQIEDQNLQRCEILCNEYSSGCSIEQCPFHENTENTDILTIASILIAFLGSIGFYLVFWRNDKIIKEKTYDLAKLGEDEKKVFIFVRNKRQAYQSEIAESFNFNKVKVTRILDKLEGLNYIERKRRGMSNIIVLK